MVVTKPAYALGETESRLDKAQFAMLPDRALS